MLERFTIATFAEHLDETFRVYPDAADSGCCLFRGPATPILPQRIYRLEHPAIDAFDLFLVPIGPDQRGMRYEAIFT